MNESDEHLEIPWEPIAYDHNGETSTSATEMQLQSLEPIYAVQSVFGVSSYECYLALLRSNGYIARVREDWIILSDFDPIAKRLSRLPAQMHRAQYGSSTVRWTCSCAGYSAAGRCVHIRLAEDLTKQTVATNQLTNESVTAITPSITDLAHHTIPITGHEASASATNIEDISENRRSDGDSLAVNDAPNAETMTVIPLFHQYLYICGNAFVRIKKSGRLFCSRNCPRQPCEHVKATTEYMSGSNLLSRLNGNLEDHSGESENDVAQDTLLPGGGTEDSEAMGVAASSNVIFLSLCDRSDEVAFPPDMEYWRSVSSRQLPATITVRDSPLFGLDQDNTLTCNRRQSLVLQRREVLFLSSVTRGGWHNLTEEYADCLVCGQTFRPLHPMYSPCTLRPTMWISNEILLEYALMLAETGCTVRGFVSVKSQMAEAILGARFASRQQFTYAWHFFSRRLKFAHNICPLCGDSPRVVIADGTAARMQKRFLPDRRAPEAQSCSDCENRFATVADERVPLLTFGNTELRAQLKQIAKLLRNSQLTEAFTRLSNSTRVLIEGYDGLVDVIAVACDESEPCPVWCRLAVADFIACLGSSSPLCSLFPRFFDNLIVREFKKACSTMGINVEAMLLQLSRLAHISTRSAAGDSQFAPNSLNDTQSCCQEPSRDVNDNYFLPPIRCAPPRAIKEMEHFESSCRHTFPSGANYTAGVFTTFCEHGVCYGWKLLTTPESRADLYGFVRSYLRTAPTVVVYDFACAAFSYVAHRDPWLANTTSFVIDRLHAYNHQGCSRVFRITNFPHLSHVNTVLAEQSNSVLVRVRKILRSSSYESFCTSLNLVLSMWNRKKIDQLMTLVSASQNV
eukprot:GILK01014815.1.p1 GENE.GILK01014815.1~~GILK01014815.1.p1  ORF type:complete len:923 (-),score=11.96 GILK01014815.1:39-2600(-)